MSEHESMQLIKYAKGKGQRARHMLARTPDSDPRRRAWKELCGEGKRERAASSDATAAPSRRPSVRASARWSVRRCSLAAAAAYAGARRRWTADSPRATWSVAATHAATDGGGSGVSGPSSVPHLPKGKGQFAVNSDPSEREGERPTSVWQREKGRGRDRSQCRTYLVGRGRVAA